MTDAPAGFEVIDGVPVSWTLGRESWIAHRMFFHQTGRGMEFREYSRLLRTRGADAECLNKKFNVWRVLANQGEIITLQRTGNCIRQILPANWTPPSAQSEPKPKAQPHKRPNAQTPAEPAPVQVRPLTANEVRRRLGVPVV